MLEVPAPATCRTQAAELRGSEEEHLRARPAGIGNNPVRFANGNKLIAFDTRVFFYEAAWPVDGQVRSGRLPKAEMKARVIARKITRLAQDRLGLDPAGVPGQHPGANGAAIRLRSYQLHLQPVVCSLQIVSQQRGSRVHIQDQNIQITVVVEIAKRAPAA